MEQPPFPLRKLLEPSQFTYATFYSHIALYISMGESQDRLALPTIDFSIKAVGSGIAFLSRLLVWLKHNACLPLIALSGFLGR
jgi:hypothetical protein